MRQSVVLVAYSCSPEGMSEKWLGWKWVQEAARDYDVVLITRPNQSKLKESCVTHEIELIEIEVPKLARLFTQRFGDLGMWLRVHEWGRRVRKKIRHLNASRKFEYGHLVTFHSVQMPFVFDGCDFTKVWGPVSGMEFVPNQYMEYLGPDRLTELLRNSILRLSKNKIIARACQYDVILYGNSQTKNAIESSRKSICRVVMPNNVNIDNKNYVSRSWNPNEQLRLLFVGSCQARRALSLLFYALQGLKHFNWQIDIAGTGSGLEYWKKLASDLSLQDKIRFHGWVGKDDVDRLYQQSHLFVFTSLRDGGGSGMLEALDRGLPVLALDWGGPSDAIGDSGAGELFPVSNPEATIESMRAWFDGLFQGQIQYANYSRAVRDFDRKQFSWKFKSDSLNSAVLECKK